MTTEKLTELLKIAYRCGRDNGSNRSEKNFNDLLQTEAISQALRILDVSRSTNTDEYTKGYRDGWRDCYKDQKAFD